MLPTTPLWSDLTTYQHLLFDGIAMTLKLATLVIISSFMGGLLLAFASKIEITAVRKSISGFVYFIRNIPLIMLIAVIHYGIFPSFNIEADFFVSAWVSLGLSASAYFSEIFRSGFLSIRPEEKESASVLGMSFIQQYMLVLLPLMFLRIVPSLMNQVVAIIKDTSLAALIGIIEISRASEIVYEQTFKEGEMLLLVAAFYFLVCYGLSFIGKAAVNPKLLSD